MSDNKPILKDKSWPMFPLDARIHTEPLRVCKSLIPYLSFERQKNISIFVKLFELMSVVDYYSNHENINNHRMDLKDKDNWQRDLLESVKSNLDPNNAFWVDIIFKFNDMQKILSQAQSGDPPLEGSSSNSTSKPVNRENISQEFMDNIAPMLDDKQKNMLKMLSTIIK